MTALSKWLAEAEARCAAATEGPWYKESDRSGYPCVNTVSGAEGPDQGTEICHPRLYDEAAFSGMNPPGKTSEYHISEEQERRNMDFIAHSRADLPRALRLLRAAVKVVEASKKVDEWVEGGSLSNFDPLFSKHREALRAYDEEAGKP